MATPIPQNLRLIPGYIISLLPLFLSPPERLRTIEHKHTVHNFITLTPPKYFYQRTELDYHIGRAVSALILRCRKFEKMDSKPSTEQQYRCKTLNCSKSFKNASSLFRHNKCCISFGKSNLNDYQFGGGDQFDPSTVAVKASNETHSSSSSNGVRDAACLCDPGEEELKEENMPISSGRNFTQAVANRLPLDEPINRDSRKIKKQVILNPDGEDSAAERYDIDDLAIDESQAAKLESYSCYAGVPQRDKAGLVLVVTQRNLSCRN